MVAGDAALPAKVPEGDARQVPGRKVDFCTAPSRRAGSVRSLRSQGSRQLVLCIKDSY